MSYKSILVTFRRMLLVGSQRIVGRAGLQASAAMMIGRHSPRVLLIALTATIMWGAATTTGCQAPGEAERSVRPRTLRDVPAGRLAFRFEADTVEQPPTANIKTDDTADKLASVQTDFDVRRKDDALLRTVVSPDGQRALALYATIDTPEGEFRIDMYTADGQFLRNLSPPELSGAFVSMVAWSPDGQWFAFIGRKSLLAQQPAASVPVLPELVSPLPEDPTAAVPAPTVAPIFAPVPVFSTEQIYLYDRDGVTLKPLTTRDGLIYFHLAWAPDNHALAALACKEDEWDVRATENRPPAGRPRLISIDGQERLLDDRLTEAQPVWSPDSSKVASAFDTAVSIYDAAVKMPTAARIPLHDYLLAASIRYDETRLQKKDAATDVNANGSNTSNSNTSNSNTGSSNTNAGSTASSQMIPSLPISFNPIVRLDWAQDQMLYVQTSFVRIYGTEAVNNYGRWHVLYLSPQATLLGQARP